jgi:hypothetical protein
MDVTYILISKMFLLLEKKGLGVAYAPSMKPRKLRYLETSHADFADKTRHSLSKKRDEMKLPEVGYI